MKVSETGHYQEQVRRANIGKQKAKKDAQIITSQHCIDSEWSAEVLRELLECMGLYEREF